MLRPAGIDVIDGLRSALARRSPAYRQRLLQRRRQPPPCRRGWEIGPPDYVGIGVEKAGTSWWWWLIRRHPDVSEPGPTKEVDFLRHLDEVDDQAIEAYRRWFPRRPGTLAGEWTPSYNELPQLGLLGELAPGARLLMLVRDPVERYRSGRAMHARYRMTDEQAVERGMYASILERVRSALPDHPLLLLQYERCVQDPTAELARTYRFLGLDDGYRPRWISHRVNPTPGRRAGLSETTRRHLVELYEPEVTRLERMVPEIDRGVWPNF